MRPISPLAPWGPGGPISPSSPFGPTAPVAPVRPISPLSPVAPVRPISPLAPWGPGGPGGPIAPSAPFGPSGPGSPEPIISISSSAGNPKEGPSLELMETFAAPSGLVIAKPKSVCGFPSHCFTCSVTSKIRNCSWTMNDAGSVMNGGAIEGCSRGTVSNSSVQSSVQGSNTTCRFRSPALVTIGRNRVNLTLLTDSGSSVWLAVSNWINAD